MRRREERRSIGATLWNAGTPVDPGPDRGRIEGRSRGPSRTALRSAPVDIEREIKALRQSTLLAPRSLVTFTPRGTRADAGQASNRTTSSPPVPVRARRDPRGTLFASYSHSRTLDIGDCSVHRVPRQVLRAVACRYSRRRRRLSGSSSIAPRRVPPAPQRTRRRSAGRARPPLATRPKGKRALPEHLPRCGPS